MTLWMSKKRPLYAPMLSSFGGGSARGMGRGIGGGVASGSYAFTTHTFTNAGAIGRLGPSQAQLDAAYGSSSWYSTDTFRSTSGIQIWTVPDTASYRFQIQGGYGGRDTGIGLPAEITADIPLVGGQEIKILVGQRGLPFYKEGSAAGGGGGTFVTYLDNTPLLVAGGGGGADGGPLGGDASLTQNGGIDGDNLMAAATGGSGGLGQNGAGGGGLLGDGADTSFAITAPPTVSSPEGGLSFINGGAGGRGFFEGGFGGGGGSAGGSQGGGGGGGYSGGAGGDGGGSNPDTGGGGTFAASNATNTSISLANTISNPAGLAPDDAPDAGFVTITML